jgi:hypothetical protein
MNNNQQNKRGCNKISPLLPLWKRAVLFLRVEHLLPNWTPPDEMRPWREQWRSKMLHHSPAAQTAKQGKLIGASIVESELLENITIWQSIEKVSIN